MIVEKSREAKMDEWKEGGGREEEKGKRVKGVQKNPEIQVISVNTAHICMCINARVCVLTHVCLCVWFPLSYVC